MDVNINKFVQLQGARSTGPEASTTWPFLRTCGLRARHVEEEETLPDDSLFDISQAASIPIPAVLQE